MPIKKIPFIKLDKQYKSYRKSIDAAIKRVLQHGQYVNGPEIAELEHKLATFLGVKHCVAVSSGTTALQVVMMALGLTPGDEVIVPDFSFFATAEVPLLLGLRPVFVDIDPRTYNLDPEAVRAAMTEQTRAIVPVSLYGQCADMPALEAIAEEFGVYLIEDAAQSLGAQCQGRFSANFGAAAATSFFPSKPLGAYGDGGACFSNDDDLVARMRLIRCHGESARYEHTVLGVNARMATLQAAVLLAKLEHFATEIEQRQQCAQRYNTLLAGVLDIPYIQPGHASVYAQYTVQVAERERVRQELAALGVPTAVHYPLPMHQQQLVAKVYPYLVKEIDCPHTQRAAETVLSLPFGPWMTEAEQQYVVDALKKVGATAPQQNAEE